MEVDSSSSSSSPSSSVHASATQWQLSFQLTGHTHTVRDIAVSSSTLLATCEERGVVHIWERTAPHERIWTKRTFEDNQIHQSLTFVIESIADAQLSHTSTYPVHTFCTGGGDKVARPFTSNGTKFTPLQGHTNSVSSITRNIHNQLITGSWDGTAKVWIGEQCIATYTGHEHAVEVLGLANGRIITGSANKSIHIIENDQIRRKITNAHGHAIRKLAAHPFGFASVGNDGLLKVWDSDGNELVSIVAHTEESKFIYGLAVLSTGDLVTCGEDGNVKIWNTNGTLIQSIPHPGPVRCVKILPGDDIITGCADRVARIFTQSEQRRASAAELSEYDELIGMVVASGMRALDTSTLPTDEALSEPGQKDGQVMVVNIRGRGPIAYQWSQEAMTWIEIGEALGSSSSNKSTLEGKEYDHVTEVYLTETDKVKLGFNKEDDPNEVVDNFMALYAIPADMRSQIYNHVAPLTDPHLVAAKKEREAKKAAELHLLQVPAWIAGSSEIYGTGNLKAMKERILKTNAEYAESNSPFAITDTGSIERLFTNLNNIVMYHASPFTSGEIGVVKQLLQWPDKEALAPMDMVRILMVHAEANKALGENSEVQQALFTHAKRGGDTHKILLLKVLSNWIAKRARPSSERDPNPTISSSVLEYLSNAMDVVADCVRTSNDKLAEAYIMFLYNFICWYGRFRIPESDFYLVLASGVIELLCGSAAPPRSDKVVYYGLLVLGTIGYISKDAATIVQASFGEQLAALVASATASANAAVREVGQDCAKIFQNQNSTRGR